LAWVNGLKISVKASLGMPMPVSAMAMCSSGDEVPTPVLGELDCVADEIDEDLPHARGVGVDHRRQGRLESKLE
jgi:hypothetical protein